jgi:L-iditol 2-dehydrogenase
MTGQMLAIVNTGPGRLELQELPLPVPGPGQVRIRTAACGICATDLAMIAGWSRTSFPAIPGHEWAGMVDAGGPGVDESLLGRPCVAENVWASDGGEVGFEHPGGYAQCFLTEAANLQCLPNGYPLAQAVLAEPLAVVVRALRRLRSAPPGPLLICGDGPIGLLALLLLAREGRTDVELAGGRESRLVLAARLGAARTLNYHAVPMSALRAGAYGSLIEASGSAAALEAALGLVKPAGRVLVLGDYGLARAGFAWSHLLHRELELIGSNASAGAWPEAVRLLLEGDLPLDALITRRLPATDFAEAFELVRDRESGMLKVVLEWEAGALNAA